MSSNQNQREGSNLQNSISHFLDFMKDIQNVIDSEEDLKKTLARQLQINKDLEDKLRAGCQAQQDLQDALARKEVATHHIRQELARTQAEHRAEKDDLQREVQKATAEKDLILKHLIMMQDLVALGLRSYPVGDNDEDEENDRPGNDEGGSRMSLILLKAIHEAAVLAQTKLMERVQPS